MSALPEEWRAVVGYEGFYEISSLGRVKSLPRIIEQQRDWGILRRVTRERFLALTPDRGAFSYGRLTAKLCMGGKARTRLVHQLVAAAFIGPCPAGMQVAHNNGDPSDNRVDNLRYASAIENTRDKFRHGTILRGEQIANSKLTEALVREIRECGLSVTGASKAFGISLAQVSRIRSGTRWGHVA